MPENTVYYHGELVAIDETYISESTWIQWAHIILQDGSDRWVMRYELTDQPVEKGRAG